jgi:hypothetical protein
MKMRDEHEMSKSITDMGRYLALNKNLKLMVQKEGECNPRKTSLDEYYWCLWPEPQVEIEEGEKE